MSLPAWNVAGVLPPIRPGEPGHSPNRSPYSVSLVSLVDRFATSPQRMVILDGLLRFRAAFHRANIVSGFQWLDGSFLEDVETLKNRPPHDMDVVTFFDLPVGQDQSSLIRQHNALFDPRQTRMEYSMDAYTVVLGHPTDQGLVQRVAYWYSLWSHRRNGLWKGFVQVDLDPSQDVDACALLRNLRGGIHHE